MSSTAEDWRSPAAAQQISFVEETCWDKSDKFKPFRTPVVFHLFSVGGTLGGPKVDVDFVSDYGLYYDRDDSALIQCLEAAAPQVDWRTDKVYHHWLDHSRIQILCGRSGRIVAQVETRRYLGRRVRPEAVDAGEYGPNVISWDSLPARRAALVAKNQESQDG